MSPFSLFPNLLRNERHNDDFKREISSQLFVFSQFQQIKTQRYAVYGGKE